ncbi:hypothetical protein NL676_020609 [Syzygium grande]|nr:hypothetical protein NL676_020609 [Syzygium grande]
MEHRERDFDIDLEVGGNCSEEGSSEDSTSATKKEVKLVSEVYGRLNDSLVNDEDGVSFYVNILNSDGVDARNTAKLVREQSPGSAQKEKRKKTSNKKAAKPPRPPRGPSLDSADQKLIKEIAQLAMLKRARNERMKALKKAKMARGSSSSQNSVIAMVFTVLFLLVILFQGIAPRTKSSVATFEGSPESAGSPLGGLISVQYNQNPYITHTNGPAYGSPRLVEEVAGLRAEGKPDRVAG